MDSGVDGIMDCGRVSSMAVAMASSMDGSMVDCLDSAEAGLRWG